MVRDLTARGIAAGVLGFLMAAYVHADYTKWGRLGLEQYLARQTMRFNDYMATPQPFFQTLMGFLVLAIGLFSLYELIVFFLSSRLNKMRRDQEPAQNWYSLGR
jgi:hypothetical protein